MSEKIKVAIAGYGNIGRGVEAAIAQNEDMVLTTVFTRRNPKSIKINTTNAKVMNMADAASLKNDIDVVILCGGSATDLPVQGPELAALFNTVDSFDTHAKIPEYFKMRTLLLFLLVGTQVCFLSTDSMEMLYCQMADIIHSGEKV